MCRRVRRDIYALPNQWMRKKQVGSAKGNKSSTNTPTPEQKHNHKEKAKEQKEQRSFGWIFHVVRFLLKSSKLSLLFISLFYKFTTLFNYSLYLPCRWRIGLRSNVPEWLLPCPALFFSPFQHTLSDCVVAAIYGTSNSIIILWLLAWVQNIYDI